MIKTQEILSNEILFLQNTIREKQIKINSLRKAIIVLFDGKIEALNQHESPITKTQIAHAKEQFNVQKESASKEQSRFSFVSDQVLRQSIG